MENKKPQDLQQARRLARKRRLRRRRMALLVGAGMIALLVVLGVLMAVSDVSAITVQGQSRYSDEEIIRQSGLAVGQNLLSVNKQSAYDRLKTALPYLDTVEIGNTSFSELCISVTETKVMAAVQVDKDWMIVGENNRALERLEGEAPAGILRILGATLQGEELGQSLLDERSLRICRTLMEQAAQKGLAGMTSINIAEKTKIELMLNERLRVLLGNETNLAVQMEVLVRSLPTLYRNNGEEVAGLLDMTFYADTDPDNDKNIFTSADLLEQMAEQQATKPDKGADKDADKDNGSATDGDNTPDGDNSTNAGGGSDG